MTQLLYSELAPWYLLITARHEYLEEAEAYERALLDAAPQARTLLELGAGAGNNAYHLKRRFTCTLTDLSPAMLAQSAAQNPECEHLVGDMRTLRLGRLFDAVFVQDAVCYLLTEDDLRLAIETAFVHCRPGGAALFAPDYVRETFRPGTECGGNDGEDGRAARYLEWVSQAEPGATTYHVDYAYVLRDGDSVRVVHERHVEGLFPRATWLRLLEEAGFRVHLGTRPRDETELDEIFVAVRPLK